MARIAQPVEVAVLKGAHKKNPQRYRKVVPKNKNPLGKPPTKFTKAQKKIWKELESYGLPGVLTQSERLILEQLVYLVEEMRDNPRTFSASKHGIINSLSSKLGMDAASRQKFGQEIPEENEEDSWDEFMQ